MRRRVVLNGVDAIVDDFHEQKKGTTARAVLHYCKTGAQACAQALRKKGLRTKIVGRSIRADSVEVEVWVVIARQKPVAEMADAAKEGAA